jgi:hypothetical protein
MSRPPSIRRATAKYDELTGLKALARRLAMELDACDEQRLVPQLARQYRETMSRIAVIEGGVDEDDEIAAIILRNRKPAAD